MKPLWDERFTPADAQIIKRKAKRMAGHYGYRTSDVDDIEQDLAMQVFQQTHRHQPDLGSREKFVGKVAKNSLINLIEAKTAKKRDRRRDINVDDAPSDVLLDGHDTPERLDMRLDVRAAIARMPADLREIALLRMELNEREVEAKLGLTRAQVRTRMQRLAAFL